MTQVILLERVEKLGQMGDVVTVKPGYARNFLFPQEKALRASKENLAYFEAQKKGLQAENDNKKKEAEKQVKKIEGATAPLIRAASETGQLFGSVTSRDIARAVSDATGEKINRSHIDINRNFKMIGLFPVTIALHPEVRVDVTINIARSEEEAQIQQDTGRALISDDQVEEKAQEQASPEADLESVLEESAIEIEKQKAEEAAADAEKQAESEAKAAEKAAKKAEAKAAQEAEEAKAAEAEGENEAEESKDDSAE